MENSSFSNDPVLDSSQSASDADVQVIADLYWLGVENLPKGFKYLAGQRIKYGEFNPCVFPEVQMCWL